MKRVHIYFTAIVAAIFIIIVAYPLFRDGMFMDGLQYAVVARNLANGVGSFWYLHLTDNLLPQFHEHPPLAFGIQSLLFKVFGDSIYVERYYSLITYFISGAVIVLIWRKIASPTFKNYYWLPLFLWILIPLVSWGASNNLLENTMAIFVLLSLYFVIRSLESSKVVFIELAGLMLFLAFLSKGFVGLYIWSAYFMIWMVRRKEPFYSWIIQTFLFVAFFGLFFGITAFTSKDCVPSLTAYFNKQIVGSIQHIQTVDSRFFIIKKVLLELLPAILLTALIIVIQTKRKVKLVETNQQWALILLLIGLSGVLPVMISMKQSGFYVLTTFPLFAMALALLIAPYIHGWISSLEQNNRGVSIVKYMMYVFVVGSILYAALQHGKIGRDKAVIRDIRAFIQIIPAESTVGIPASLYPEWSYHGYFARYGKINMDPDRPFEHLYYFKNLNSADTVSPEFEKVDVPTEKFELYRKKLR